MERIRTKTQEFNRRLQPYCKERQSAMQDFKLENLITNKDCKDFGNSSVARNILSNLNEIRHTTQDQYSTEQAIECRNYLMFMLCVTNALRASNLINITLADVANAKHDEEFNAMVISSSKYKTSMLYGKKMIVCSQPLYKQLTKFMIYFRPKLANENDSNIRQEERALFLSVNAGEKMSHSTISNGMTQLLNSVPELKTREK